MAKREWNGSARIWGGILGGAVVLAVLLALAVQNFTAQPAGPAQESSMGSESSSLRFVLGGGEQLPDRERRQFGGILRKLLPGGKDR